VNKNNNIRDLIYISGNEINHNCFYSYGIEFHEFMSCISEKPELLILLKHKFDDALLNLHSRFEYVTSNELKDLINDDVYGYGDFCWIDMKTADELDHMSKQHIAELLYFGHLAEPLHRLPMARFAYYAHDDGWFNKLYVTDIEDYECLLWKVLLLKLTKLTRRSFVDIPPNLSMVLLEFTKEGLFIDLSKIKKSRNEVAIPITAIGHYRDMDKVYDLRDEIEEYKLYLVYSQKSWRMEVK